MKIKTDYDKISSNYNQRYQAHPMQGVGNALKNALLNSNAKRIMEVGCGTGRWLSELGNDDIFRIGVDSSLGMLKKAAGNQPGLNLICASANGLPFNNNHFDMIFCVNAVHHFTDKSGFIRGAAKILKRSGVLSIIGVCPFNENDKWYVYDYFENVLEKDLSRFPSFDDVERWMEDAGIKQIRRSIAESVERDLIGEEVFKDNFLQKEQSSQLASLSDAEYASGIQKITNAIRNNPHERFSTRLTFTCITGIKL